MSSLRVASPKRRHRAPTTLPSDPNTDPLSIDLNGRPGADAREVGAGGVLALNAAGQPVGIDIRHVPRGLDRSAQETRSPSTRIAKPAGPLAPSPRIPCLVVTPVVSSSVAVRTLSAAEPTRPRRVAALGAERIRQHGGTPPMARSTRTSPTRVVAFFNQKGGTAKTTSTLNVAAALAERGRRVLALDMDPQASLTMAIGVDVAGLDRSIYDLLLEDGLGIADVATPTTIPGVTLVPSHPDLAAAELELLSVLERERQLDYRLGAADLAPYDYVLIDSPPALNVLSVNILVAADELVVPIEPHPLSLMVLRRLFETVHRIRRLNPELRVVGFLPTKVHHSSRLAADMLATLAEEFPEMALLPAVPLSVKGAESAAERTSILQYMPRSAVAAAYREVGAWLETNDPVAPAAAAATAERTPLHA